MKRMNNKQLFEFQQKKIKGQDNKIDDILLRTKEGQIVTREVHNELDKQVKFLDTVENDVD